MANTSPEEKGIAIVLVIQTANVSFYGCSVHGFQDSLWFRNSRVAAYFKDCYIEGGIYYYYLSFF